MNILTKKSFNKDQNIDLISHIYDDDYTLIINGYHFYIDEEHIDYPIIDSNIYNNIMADIELLYNLRTS